MPPHPDRVRRNYHTVEIKEMLTPFATDIVLDLKIKLTRMDIASVMNKKEAKYLIFNTLNEEIDKNYPTYKSDFPSRRS